MVKKYLNTRIAALLLLITALGPYAYGCLQTAGRIRVGKRIKIEGVPAPDFVRGMVSHEGRAYWEKARSDLERQRRDYQFLENRNNLAVALIHLGQVKEAIPMLEEVERKHPGQYFTAANLGTAYELSGDNQKALEWIKEGVNRNKESHHGTEWLHVKILEAKLATEKDPDWLKKHSVLGADFRGGEDQQPKRLATDHFGRPKSLAEIEDALIYQLHERLEFVKPPEPIVADLLFDLSNVLALMRTSEHAKAVYELSRSYGPSHADLVSSRPAGESRADTPQAPQGRYLFYSVLGAALLLVMGGFYALIRRRKLHRRHT